MSAEAHVGAPRQDGPTLVPVETGGETMPDSRPSWQRTVCPPWCDASHAESDHPDDRVHRGLVRSVTVVSRVRRFRDGRMIVEDEELEFDVGLSRADGDSVTWLYVGQGPARSIEIAVGDAAALVAAMVDAAGRAEDRMPSAGHAGHGLDAPRAG